MSLLKNLKIGRNECIFSVNSEFYPISILEKGLSELNKSFNAELTDAFEIKVRFKEKFQKKEVEDLILNFFDYLLAMIQEEKAQWP